MRMKISEARKGLRVRLSDEAKARHTLPADIAIDLRRSMLIPRHEGTLRSGRVLHSQPPYEEGLFVYVKWDGLPTPEKWHLADLVSCEPRRAAPPEGGV